MFTLLQWACILFFVYTIIPSIVSFGFGLGVVRRGQTGRQVAFTFDDGPDPRYTPKLLDLLKKHSVKATFFVLGHKAEENPELILRIYQEGHLIGIHNYVHRSNWLMTPWTLRRQLKCSASFIEKITGERPVYYRPPWGLLNLFDFSLRKHFRIVLWSLMAWDWRSQGGSEKVRRHILRKLKAGAVVLLHDSGDTVGANQDAPSHTIQALESVFREIHSQGYSCVRLDGMPLKQSRKKQFLVYLWMKWEALIHTLFAIKPLDQKDSFFYVRVRKYYGKTLHLSDGKRIEKGDKVVELHFNNEFLAQMVSTCSTPIQLAVQMVRLTEQFLPQLLAFILQHPEGGSIKGLYGISVIYRGSRQLGFTVQDVPNRLFARICQFYLRLLLFIVHPQGRRRLQKNGNLLTPKIISISKDELIRRYSIHT
jgi:peptidoglycan-N-acetylglucosamine deacetylase